MARFRVVAGSHNEGGVTYRKGDIVDSKSDLSKLNSPGSLKFQRAEDVEEAARQGFYEGNTDKPKPSNGPDEFDAMTIPDLKKFAAQEGIDLGTATKKDEILVAIRSYVKELMEA